MIIQSMDLIRTGVIETSSASNYFWKFIRVLIASIYTKSAKYQLQKWNMEIVINTYQSIENGNFFKNSL